MAPPRLLPFAVRRCHVGPHRSRRLRRHRQMLLRGRQHAAGIVFGFGVSAAGALVAFLLRSEFGTKFDPVVRIAPPIAYIIGVAIWLATFLKAESARPETAWAATLTPEQMLTELKRHTKTVKGILGR